MATKYYRNVASDWDTDGNWSLSTGGPANTTYPIAGDDVIFDGNSGTCTLDASAACDSVAISGGTLDLATYDLNLGQTGTITTSGGTFKMGSSAGTGVTCGDCDINTGSSIDLQTDSDIHVYGDLLIDNIAIFVNSNRGSFRMYGSSKIYNSRHSSNQPYELRIEAGAIVDSSSSGGPERLGAYFIVDGTFTLNDDSWGEHCTISATGVLISAGDFALNSFKFIGGVLSINIDPSADISQAHIRLEPRNDLTVPPQTYGGLSLVQAVGVNEPTFTLQAGTYTILQLFRCGHSNAGDAVTVDATAGPTIRFSGDVEFDWEVADSVIWQAGSGTIYIEGTAAQSIDFAGETVEKISVTNSSAKVNFTVGFTTAEFKCETAGAQIEFQSGQTFTFTTMSLVGTKSSHVVVTASTGGSAANFTVTNGTALHVTVSDNDASVGNDVIAAASTEGTGVTDWVFGNLNEKLTVDTGGVILVGS